MTRRAFIWCWSCLLLAASTACHSEPAEPEPPPASYELASAPPGARGARAAGTDAAPPPPTEHELADPSSEETPDEQEPDAGAPGDGGIPTDAGTGIAL